MKYYIKNAYYDSWYHIGGVEFADGTAYGLEELKNLVCEQVGTSEADIMNGYDSGYNYNTSETFYAGAGDDMVNGGYGNDTIYGGTGDDTVSGNNGDDILVGGAGNDKLAGGSGSDIYYIGMDDGNDIINNYDSSTSRENDKIVYGEGISVDDIFISRQGNDLLITNSKTEQVTTVSNAYNSDYYKLYNLEFEDLSTAVIDYTSTTLEIKRSEVEKKRANSTGTEAAEVHTVDILEDIAEDIVVSGENSQENGDEVVKDSEVDTVQEDVDISEDMTAQGETEIKVDVQEETDIEEIDVQENTDICEDDIQTETEADSEPNNVDVSGEEETEGETNTLKEVEKNAEETTVSKETDVDVIVDNAVSAIEKVETQEEALTNLDSANEEEVSISTYAEVSDSDITKMADLIVQEIVETSSQSIVQDSSVTEVNNETTDVQLWVE